MCVRIAPLANIKTHRAIVKIVRQNAIRAILIKTIAQAAIRRYSKSFLVRPVCAWTTTTRKEMAIAKFVTTPALIVMIIREVIA